MSLMNEILEEYYNNRKMRKMTEKGDDSEGYNFDMDDEEDDGMDMGGFDMSGDDDYEDDEDEHACSCPCHSKNKPSDDDFDDMGMADEEGFGDDDFDDMGMADEEGFGDEGGFGRKPNPRPSMMNASARRPLRRR